MPYCSNCGAEVDAGDTHCHSCGASVSSGREQPAGGGQSLPQETDGGISFALGYPKRDGWTPVLISTLLLVGSFLIVPAFILVGYGFRVARAAALGRPNPPSYDDWGGLIVDGLRFLGMYILLGIVVGIPLFILQRIAIASESVVLLLLYFVVSIVAGYATVAFYTAFVGSNSISDAFTNGQAFNLLRSGYYLRAYLLSIVLGIILVVLLFVSIITIVGWLAVYAYIVLAQAAFWGLVYYRAAQEGIVSPPVEDDQQTTK